VTFLIQFTAKTVRGTTLKFPVPQRFVEDGVIITPDIAEAWLKFSKEEGPKHGFRNRPMSRTSLIQYATDMSKGLWSNNAEPIKVAPEGYLTDGYTRMNACVLAKTNFPTFIAFGIPPDITHDRGRARTLSNSITMFDNSDVPATVLAQATSYLYRYFEDDVRVSVPSLDQFRHQHPDLGRSVMATEPYRRKRLGVDGVIVCSHYICARQIGLAKANDFFAMVYTDSTPSSSPVTVLRDYLRKSGHDNSRDKGANQLKAFLCCFQKWYDGERMQRLHLPEKAPQLKRHRTAGA